MPESAQPSVCSKQQIGGEEEVLVSNESVGLVLLNEVVLR